MELIILALAAFGFWRLIKDLSAPKGKPVGYTKDSFFDGILNEADKKERHRRIAALREEQAIKVLQLVSDYLHDSK